MVGNIWYEIEYDLVVDENELCWGLFESEYGIHNN